MRSRQRGQEVLGSKGKGYPRAWSALVAAALLPLGCGAHAAKSAFSRDYSCEDKIFSEDLGGGRYHIVGCGHAVDYACEGAACALETATDDVAPRRASSSSSRPRSATKLRGSGESEATVNDGRAPMELEVRLAGALLKLNNGGRDRGVIRLRLSYVSEVLDEPSCALEWMLNGEAVEAPKAKFAQNGQLVTQSLALPADFVASLATARKMGLKSCERHWTLLPAQIADVQGFIQMVEDDAAWSADPKQKKQKAKRFVAPTGGWPAWSAGGPMANASKAGPALDGPALFKLLAPSVFQVESLSTSGGSQGSAVAIAATELLTNCHVLEGAWKVIVKHDKKEWVAKIVRSDPDRDKCVLGVDGATFPPVRGVRPYESLEVGETVYTLGAPRGFDLSLANGVLSGQREHDGQKLIQTTAPISPGSSGGGLFDARGNLIGITTLIVVDRDRVNQSLNFAIAAEQFFQ